MKSSIVMSETDYIHVHRHLWRDDFEEHAAILGVSVSKTGTQLRLLVRNVLLVPDEFFVPGRCGYHLDARFISDACLQLQGEGLGYVSVHSHPLSDDTVGLSNADIESNRRSFPATLDLVNGRPVASLVLGYRAAAGEIWGVGKEPHPLDFFRVIGTRITDYVPEPVRRTRPYHVNERHQRQAMMFGKDGQEILRRTCVGVVGLGGGGSVVVQQLAHLGVGDIIGIDDDVVKKVNLNRIVGSRPADARMRRKKGVVLKRLVRSIDPKVQFTHVDGDVTKLAVAQQLLDCDFIFCATDNLRSRNVINQLCYQFLIPGVQIGVKVETDKATGEVIQIHGNVRSINPTVGCLACHGAINPAVLSKELLSPEARRAQDYTNEPDVEDPAVISLNSGVASMAVGDFQMLFTGLFPDLPEVLNLHHRMWLPLTREWLDVPDNRNESCRICSRGSGSMYALGDQWQLMPVRE
ncbi:MAG: HesA/MoeB/ThiF family protein [Armatimonadota bacterium]